MGDVQNGEDEVRLLPEMVRKRQREPAAAAVSLRPPVGSVPFPGLFQAGEAAAESAWVSLHFDLWLKCFSSGYPLKAPPVVLVNRLGWIEASASQFIHCRQ